MSDQPATCPLCGAILRQSRNLRRHLELLHFGNGKPTKGSVRVKHRKTSSNEIHRASQILLNSRESTAADLSSLNLPRSSSDLQTVTPLSMVSSASVSSVSNLSLPGNMMSGGVTSGSTEQSCIPVSSCAAMGPPTNGLYSSDGTASMLSCLLPPLSSLSSLSSPHDVFRHGDILRAGVTYYDTSRQQSRHIHRADVT